MKKLLIALFIIMLGMFAYVQTASSQSVIYVTNKEDKRLISYLDSIKCYIYGVKQLKIAKSIDKDNIEEGKKAWDYLLEYNKSLNQKIKRAKNYPELAVAYRRVSGGIWVWMPDSYKYPEVKVIYKSEIVKKQVIVTKKSPKLSKIDIKPIVLTKKVNIIYTTNGILDSINTFKVPISYTFKN